jgi:predicted enzyme related to lactoylglutathione lyase
MVRLRKSNVVFLVADIAATMRWYEHLGFRGRAVPESPPHTFAIISRDEVFIMLQQLGGYVKPDLYAKRDGGVWNVYIDTQDVAALYQEVSRHRDVTILRELCPQEYGQIEFEVVDPNGYVLVFAQPVGEN